VEVISFGQAGLLHSKAHRSRGCLGDTLPKNSSPFPDISLPVESHE